MEIMIEQPQKIAEASAGYGTAAAPTEQTFAAQETSIIALVAERTRKLSEANVQLRRKQQELEQANAELARLDELKSEFVALVSHELRAPLTNISGSLQLLLHEDAENPLTPMQREIISLANEQTERLTHLVKGVLSVAHIEAGEMPFAFQAINMDALIERLLEQWRICDTSHVWLGPEHPNLPSVWGDRERIEQVLTNLLDNAYKYSREQGTIRVDARVADNYLLVSVSDEGEGIAPEELDKIFSKFHRVERGDARRTYGYGLGLYIALKLIEAMGGELGAESEPGKGSRFFFTLPLAAQTDETPFH